MKMEAVVQGISMTTIVPVHLDMVATSVKINVRNQLPFAAVDNEISMNYFSFQCSCMCPAMREWCLCG